MTRVKISVGILLLMLGVSIFSGIWVNKRCGELISGVKQLESIADSGDYESAAKLAEELDEPVGEFQRQSLVLHKVRPSYRDRQGFRENILSCRK